MAVLVHVGAQEVLEAVVDLQPGSCHGNPLPHRVALQSGKTPSDPPTQTLSQPDRKSYINVSVIYNSKQQVLQPSCPPGSRCSRSFPHPLPLRCLQLHVQPIASSELQGVRHPHLRCLDDGKYKKLFTQSPSASFTPLNCFLKNVSATLTMKTLFCKYCINMLLFPFIFVLLLLLLLLVFPFWGIIMF